MTGCNKALVYTSTVINPITYGGGGGGKEGGLYDQNHQIINNNIAPQNLVTFNFYLLH